MSYGGVWCEFHGKKWPYLIKITLYIGTCHPNIGSSELDILPDLLCWQIPVRNLFDDSSLIAVILLWEESILNYHIWHTWTDTWLSAFVLTKINVFTWWFYHRRLIHEGIENDIMIHSWLSAFLIRYLTHSNPNKMTAILQIYSNTF